MMVREPGQGDWNVISSKHISDEDAKEEFIEHLESKGYDVSDCEFKKMVELEDTIFC